MNDDRNSKPRFEGANWDEPEVKVTRSGGKGIERKVLTVGTMTIDATALLGKIEKLMRQGNEVRLTRRGQDALRFVPLADLECRKIEPRAFFMGDMARMLDDKKLRITRLGAEIPQSDVQRIVNRARELGRETAKRRRHVTPDTMVNCPKCGFQFRVGRPNKE